MFARTMKVLIGCEHTGITRDQFRLHGWDAWSCDLLPSERPGPHIQGNVLEVVRSQKWDLFICHPPCQFLSYAGKRYWNDPGRAEKRQAAFEFFMRCYWAPVDLVAVENPLGYPVERFRSADQIIYPYYFGDPEQKRLCLWLRGLPKLVHTKQPDLFYRQTHGPKPEPVYIQKDGQKLYFTHKTAGNSKSGALRRSRSFEGVAAAMAEQWTDFFLTKYATL